MALSLHETLFGDTQKPHQVWESLVHMIPPSYYYLGITYIKSAYVRCTQGAPPHHALGLVGFVPS